MNDEKVQSLHSGNSFDARLDAALRRKPSVPVPSGFAALVVARTTRQIPGNAANSVLPRRFSWGAVTSAASLALLLLLMVRFAHIAPEPVPGIAECALACEFLALLFGFLNLRRLVG